MRDETPNSEPSENELDRLEDMWPDTDSSATASEDATLSQLHVDPRATTRLLGTPARRDREATHALEVCSRYHYRLRKLLGRGGFGAVYLASCTEGLDGVVGAPPATVAIKLFHPPAEGDSQQFLKRELSALLALRHSRIPRLYDWTLEGNDAFAVFEFYPSGSLADQLARGGSLDERSSWRLMADLLSALRAAHRASLLHLDIKPGNVLLDAAGGFALTDFGISQGSLVSRMVVPTGLGASAFQSPEQRRADHEALDPRTDLWGVGMTVWCAYTGTSPSKQPSLLRTNMDEHEHGLPYPSELRPGCSRDFEKVVMGLLSIDQEKRPGGAAEALHIDSSRS